MEYIKKYIDIITRAITPVQAKSKTGGRGSAVIVFDDNGDISEINISSSLINKFYKKGEKRDICPLKMYLYHIEKKYQQPPTDNMIAGLYLESGLIGATADGNAVTDMPRDKRTGAKKEVQKRIEQHFNLWDMRKELHGIQVYKDGDLKNVQIRQKQKWESRNHTDINIYVYMTADLLSPIKDKGFEYDMAVIDIKGTGDVNSEWGDYCWGKPENMDHLQLILYSRILGIDKAAYMVFDWAKNPNYKIVPVNVNPNHSDSIKANEAKLRIKEVEQTIEGFVSDLIFYTASGWTVNPKKEHCGKCENIYCDNYNRTFEV